MIKRLKTAAKSRWPDQRPFAVALSHDVDRTRKRAQYFYLMVLALRNRSPQKAIEQFYSLVSLLQGKNPYWNFDRIRRLEDEIGVRSTFFFMEETGKARLTSLKSQILFRNRYRLDSPNIKKTIHDLNEGGWEVGLHGSYNSYLSKTLLSKEKTRLESILGHPVPGTRQHYLRLAIPDTWKIHAELGFTYDSTLGYSDRIGFRYDQLHPFFPADPISGRTIPVLQLPIGIMDVPLMKLSKPWESALAIIEQVEDCNGVLVLDWHQRVFNSWEYYDYQDIYVRIMRECQRREALVGTCSQIAQAWLSEAC